MNNQIDNQNSKHKHLTLSQRIAIELGLTKGLTLRAIALSIGKDLMRSNGLSNGTAANLPKNPESIVRTTIPVIYMTFVLKNATVAARSATRKNAPASVINSNLPLAVHWLYHLMYATAVTYPKYATIQGITTVPTKRMFGICLFSRTPAAGSICLPNSFRNWMHSFLH